MMFNKSWFLIYPCLKISQIPVSQASSNVQIIVVSTRLMCVMVTKIALMAPMKKTAVSASYNQCFVLSVIDILILFYLSIFFFCLVFNCTASQFACATGNQCIGSYYQCDGVFDCNDHSDETNCRK